MGKISHIYVVKQTKFVEQIRDIDTVLNRIWHSAEYSAAYSAEPSAETHSVVLAYFLYLQKILYLQKVLYVTKGSVYNWHDTLPQRNSWVFHKFDSIQLLAHGSYYFPHQDMMHFMDKASSHTSINSVHTTFGICCLHKRVEIMMLKDSLRPEPRRKFVHKKVISIKNLLRRGSFQKFDFNQRTTTSGWQFNTLFIGPRIGPYFGLSVKLKRSYRSVQTAQSDIVWVQNNFSTYITTFGE